MNKRAVDAAYLREKAVKLTDHGHRGEPFHLSGLGIVQQVRFEHLGNLSDLENAISNTGNAVKLTDDGNPRLATS